MKRFDIRAILANPAARRMLIARSTVATQAREGIDVTLEEALASYDSLEASGELERVRQAARNWRV